MRAYYLICEPEDFKEYHDSGIVVTAEELRCTVNFQCWHFEGPDTMKHVNEIAEKRNYAFRDHIVISPEANGDDFEPLCRGFYQEHTHTQDEARYITEGEGLWDVRTPDEKWIRVIVSTGDFIVLPPGVYHRFTPTATNLVASLRFFKNDPARVAVARSDASDTHA